MNITPATTQYIPKRPSRRTTKRLDNADNRTREHMQADRRTHAERRRFQMNYHESIDMRQCGDRRRSNRIFVTT